MTTQKLEHEPADQLKRLVLSREQVAELLAVRKDTILNLHRMGELLGVKVGRHLRWRPADVVRFVEGLTTDQ